MCGAAIGCCGIAFWFLTFHFQIFSEKPSLNKNLLRSFWLIRVLWVLLQEYHGLHDFLTFGINEPSVMMPRLSTPQIEVHFGHQKCISWISCMPLKVIHHN